MIGGFSKVYYSVYSNNDYLYGCFVYITQFATGGHTQLAQCIFFDVLKRLSCLIHCKHLLFSRPLLLTLNVSIHHGNFFTAAGLLQRYSPSYIYSLIRKKWYLFYRYIPYLRTNNLLWLNFFEKMKTI